MDYSEINIFADPSETLTPLKARHTFDIAQDLDNNEDIVKIPHGLTAKANRRKSFHHVSKQDGIFSLTPKRAPLTAPRPNALNSQPMRADLELSKRSLIDQLKSLRGGKENSPMKENCFLSSSAAPSPSNFQLKRLSSEAIDPEDFNVSKRLQQTTMLETDDDKEEDSIFTEKTTDAVAETAAEDILNSSFNGATEEDVVSAVDAVIAETTDDGHDAENDNDEELSRIEPFSGTKSNESDLPTNRFILESIDDEEQIEQEPVEQEIDDEENHDELAFENLSKCPLDEASLKPTTPSRITEPVAMSPKTEQNSRVIDESILLLDTTKSPVIDDSFIAESPSVQHTTLALEHPGSSILEHLDDFGLSPQKRSHLSTPNQRPFFTISQVHEIQNEFKIEAEKLEETLKLKSAKIVELNNEINNNKNQVFELQDVIESLTLQKRQTLKENELLRSEQDLFKKDISNLESSLKVQDEKLVKHKFVIGKFKDRVQELQQTIKEQTEQYNALNENFESSTRAVESLQSRVKDFEQQAQRLASDLNSQKLENEKYHEVESSLRSEIESLRTEFSSLEQSKNVLEVELSHANKEIEAKSDLLEVSSKENEDARNYIASLENDIASKVSETDSLNSKITELEAQINDTQLGSLQESAKLQELLKVTQKELNLKTLVIDSLNSGIATLHKSLESSKELILDQREEFEKLELELNEADDLLIVRKAEVDELNTELKTVELEANRLKEIIEELREEKIQLSVIIQQNNEVIQTSNEKIESLETDLQRQESEHLAELEAFHAEMSNVQNMVSSKSNDLHMMKEARDDLSREIDMLKYELQTLREESGEYETRVSNMKVRLQESKNYTQKLEAQIAKLKEEKANLDLETDKRLQQLADDLYIQYSKKHEQKVQVLKKGYETKWQGKVTKAEHENEKLRREIEGLKTQLEQEKHEKNEMIKLWDKLKSEEAGNEPQV